MRTTMPISLFVSLLTLPALTNAQTTTYRRPFQGNYGVTAHYDADRVRGNGSDQDYTCASWAYDGHGGTDYGTPLGTTIVAAAAGTVTRTNDGCANYGYVGNTCGGSLGNYVELRHADNTMTVYAHMKLGSLKVSPGQTVECGQALGLSASSGSSTGPHLHFGSRAAGGAHWGITETRDPYKGACGRNTSLWVNQGSYKGAPGTTCQVTKPEVYDIDVWIEATGIEDQLTQGTSLEQPDALPGDVFEVSIYVHNKSGVPIRDVELGYLLAAHVEAIDYVIESDVSGGGAFGVNDADAHEGNPPKDGLGKEGALTMYAFADGETKRVRMTVTALEPVTGGVPAVRGWLRNVTDVHVQAAFDEAPSMTAADEPLQAGQRVDVLAQDAWVFSSMEPEMLEGWTACEGTQARVDPMRLGAVIAGDTRCLTSPAWTEVDAAAVNQLELEIEPESEPHTAALFWSASADGPFLPENSIVFDVEAGVDRLEVGLYDAATWSGAIRRLQLHSTWEEPPGAESVIRAVRFRAVKPPVVEDEPGDPDASDGDPIVEPGTDPEQPTQNDMVIDGRGGCSTPGGSPGGAGALVLVFVALGWLLRGTRFRRP